MNALRFLPKMDILLNDDKIIMLLSKHPRALIIECLRYALFAVRKEISDGSIKCPIENLTEYVLNISYSIIDKSTLFNLRPVVNATGTILHTNLGRSMMNDEIGKAVYNAATSYSNLEYDIEKGERGSRNALVESIICKVTGAEAAMAVNNNAAAVMLILSALAKGGEVIVSRGELVEIGGSFRVPDIMELSGAILKEVGTTNKTHLSDYQKAINANTVALMKIHTSNFKIMGFTQEVLLSDMVKLGNENKIPVIHDLGSGCIFDLEAVGLFEPCILQSVNSLADVISFSGDKLLGGPQAGIVIGKKQYIDKLKKHPMARALRLGKLSLAALEATMRMYVDKNYAINNIPTLQMIFMPMSTLKERGEKFLSLLDSDAKVYAELIEDKGQIGGGSLPNEFLPTMAISIKGHINKLEKALRTCPIPIIARLCKERLLIDMRTIQQNQIEYVANELNALLKGKVENE